MRACRLERLDQVAGIHGWQTGEDEHEAAHEEPRVETAKSATVLQLHGAVGTATPDAW